MSRFRLRIATLTATRARILAQLPRDEFPYTEELGIGLDLTLDRLQRQRENWR